MTNWTNKSNKSNSKPGGYESLIVYQQAVVISSLNHQFCQKYLSEPKYRRTVEQMAQADRSGKQNIVEASLEKSLKMNIKLTGVARASYGELLEDYRDFLRFRRLTLWEKNDPRVLKIRSLRVSANESNLTNWSYWTGSPESFANLMITLISKENYLLDQMIRSLERKFIEEGGYSENLFKKRLEFRERKK
ncbi:MAG: four helix bundle suffix domain-containing protein [Patescibacteria group bacterium]